MSRVDDLTRIQPIKRTSLALRSQSTGELHELSGEMLVGREVECDIQLASLQISRYHAKVYVSANGAFIEDLKSSNGTFVNGRQIRSRTAISVGDQITFDDLEFRVTTTRSGEADFTQLAHSQGLPRESVSKINQVADISQLKPAPSTPQERAREVAAQKRSQPSPASQRAAPQQPAPRQSAQKPPPRDFLKPIKEPKVHEIPDMDEFLKFAGSGLKAQEPIAKKDAIPFGLSKQKTTDDDEAPTKFIPPVSDRSLPPEPQMDFSQPQALPEQTPLESQTSAEPRMRREGDTSSPQEDDENTRYVSLNTMDRYVVTNERFQSELNVGSGPRLIAMTAPIRGKVFQLDSPEDVKCWSIGRDDSADVCLRDKIVSREHAWITKLDSLYQLRVNETANEILVNGASCVEADLKHGDRLQFGTMELVFRLDTRSDKPAQEKTNLGFWSRLKSVFGRNA